VLPRLKFIFLKKTYCFPCRYVAIVWPDIPSFAVYKASDWSVVDSGTGKLFAWDTCRDRYALVESALPPRMPLVVKGGSSKKAKEAAAAAAQAAAAAASAASAATVQVRILLDDGTSHVLQRSIDGRSEPVSNHHFSCISSFVCEVFISVFSIPW
jgi:uncharacterized protein (DUF1786 family)